MSRTRQKRNASQEEEDLKQDKLWLPKFFGHTSVYTSGQAGPVSLWYYVYIDCIYVITLYKN